MKCPAAAQTPAAGRSRLFRQFAAEESLHVLRLFEAGHRVRMIVGAVNILHAVQHILELLLRLPGLRAECRPERVGLCDVLPATEHGSHIGAVKRVFLNVVVGTHGNSFQDSFCTG